MRDAFVGLMSTRGGNKFWNDMASVDFFGDDLLKEVSVELKKTEIPNTKLPEILPWLRADKEWIQQT